MSSELALNAYILLGNALHYVANMAQSNYNAELNESPTAIQNLYRALEPQTPNQILAKVESLPKTEKSLLNRCCRFCLRTMEDGEVEAKLGLPRSVAADVLDQLALENSHA